MMSWLRRKKGKSFMKERERGRNGEYKRSRLCLCNESKIHNDNTACDFIEGVKTQMDERTR